MTVDSKHPFYSKRIKEWNMVSDILEGESAIKEAGITYLPKLTGQSAKEYSNYLGRGNFFNASARTIQALSGLVMRKGTKVEVTGKDLEDLMDTITTDGVSIQDVIRIVVDNLIGFGYYGILVDLKSGDGKTQPFFSLYSAQDIINWKFKTDETGNIKLTLLVLQEFETKDGDDEFEAVKVEKLRVLKMQKGKCFVDTYTQGDDGAWVRNTNPGTIEMRVRGKSLDFIPFQFFGTVANVPIPPKPPLLDLLQTNIQHWKINVDYNHGLHFCALPTPWAAGWPADTKIHIGSTRAWVTEQPNAKCGYLEFSGEGLTALKEAMIEIERRMAFLGARLLEDTKKTAESTETYRMKSMGDTATLSSIVGGIERGFSNLLKICYDWMGKSGKPSVVMNKDFISTRLTPQEMDSLLKALQAGEISQDTFLDNLKLGEIIPDDRTVEEEKDLIELRSREDEEFVNNVIPIGMAATVATIPVAV